ncbi:MAG TPA: hypothetical protein VMD74_03720 [Candidatus Methylomirabilis sp.]|nr:hypothetical protein [Candidatus Methylomirabilis sp.]
MFSQSRFDAEQEEERESRERSYRKEHGYPDSDSAPVNSYPEDSFSNSSSPARPTSGDSSPRRSPYPLGSVSRSSFYRDNGHVPVSGAIAGSSFDNGLYNFLVDVKRLFLG